jgi:hypothetical protein
MKVLKLFVLTTCALAFFTGCLQVNTKVNFNKDGSGTIEEVVLMSDAVVAMMNEFMSSFQDSTSAPEDFKLFKEEELMGKSLEYGEGVEYVTGEEIKTDGWEGYRAVYSFDDINQIKITTDPNDKIESGTLGEREHFSFQFFPGETSELIINRPELSPSDIKLNADTENENTEMDDKFIKLLEGMKVKISLDFESGIIETNAEYANETNITLFDIDFNKLLKNKDSLEMMKSNPPESLDDMKALIENVPGIKIDLQKSITVKF